MRATARMYCGQGTGGEGDAGGNREIEDDGRVRKNEGADGVGEIEGRIVLERKKDKGTGEWGPSHTQG